MMKLAKTIYFIFLLTIRVDGIGRCPADLQDVEGKFCILSISRTMPYCEAHETCAEEGRKRGINMFLISKHAPILMRHPTLWTEPIFTGTHSFLTPAAGSSSPGWMVSDPGSEPFTVLTDKWRPVNYNYAIEEVLLIYKDGLRDVSTAGEQYSVVCEMSTVAWPDFSKPSMFNKSWPIVLTENILQKYTYGGCFEFVRANTLTHCGFECASRVECRSFYYNKAQQNCSLSLYVDSRMPRTIRDGPSWIRFGRQN